MKKVLLSTTALSAFALTLFPVTAANATGGGSGCEVATWFAELEIKEERSGYNDKVRDSFGYDGSNTRDKVLEQEKRTDGTWLSVWDGKTYSDPGKLEVDHTVSLAEAYQSHISDSARVPFGTDTSSPITLNAITAGLNQSKSGSDFAEWVPPKKEDKWIHDYVKIKHDWNLSVDQAEYNELDTAVMGWCARNTGGDNGDPTPTPTPTEEPEDKPSEKPDPKDTEEPKPKPKPEPTFKDRDCAAFDTQNEAQEFFEKTDGDPHRLDEDNDLLACEALPYQSELLVPPPLEQPQKPEPKDPKDPKPSKSEKKAEKDEKKAEKDEKKAEKDESRDGKKKSKDEDPATSPVKNKDDGIGMELGLPLGLVGAGALLALAAGGKSWHDNRKLHRAASEEVASHYTPSEDETQVIPPIHSEDSDWPFFEGNGYGQQ